MSAAGQPQQHRRRLFPSIRLPKGLEGVIRVLDQSVSDQHGVGEIHASVFCQTQFHTSRFELGGEGCSNLLAYLHSTHLFLFSSEQGCCGEGQLTLP